MDSFDRIHGNGVVISEDCDHMLKEHGYKERRSDDVPLELSSKLGLYRIYREVCEPRRSRQIHIFITDSNIYYRQLGVADGILVESAEAFPLTASPEKLKQQIAKILDRLVSSGNYVEPA